jgi:glycoprotein endo-alpha-1,2-mannosidase
MVVCLTAPYCTQAVGQDIRADANAPFPRLVLAFYYPWYGTPEGKGGDGRMLHWGQADPTRHDIAASTDYPELGPYDSYESKVIDQHCRWAAQTGIDGFIVSWWGHDSYADRAMPAILDVCAKHGLKACAYYEQVPREGTPQVVADEIVALLGKYGSHRAYLRVRDKPVVFIYGRAVDWDFGIGIRPLRLFAPNTRPASWR